MDEVGIKYHIVSLFFLPCSLSLFIFTSLPLRVSADDAIKSITFSGALNGTKKLLDVGGGDGTIATSLMKKAIVEGNSDLLISVFNLPASAALARQTFANAEKSACGGIPMTSISSRLDVVEGNFLTGDLPSGYDTIMFSRVVSFL